MSITSSQLNNPHTIGLGQKNFYLDKVVINPIEISFQRFTANITLTFWVINIFQSHQCWFCTYDEAFLNSPKEDTLFSDFNT